jgi:molecular chaperone DnaK
MGHVIGIDLGTTNTAVAVLVDGRPKMLEDEHGYKVVPSIVWVGDDGEVKVGQQCKSLLVSDPPRTAFAVKRLLGRRFSSDEVTDARPRMGYAIGEAEDGTCLVELSSGTLTPEEVSAHVLRTAKQMAERALGGPVDEAVITVPAYFNHAQRASTMKAASLAGLTCERLLNEPTAAALAYGFRKEIDRTLLIFDLGGGTFDVSVLRLSSGVYEILSTLGDTYLGGEDFDHRIVDWMADRFLAAHGVDLRLDRSTHQRLKEAAERAKCELSFTEQVQVHIPHVGDGLNVDETLDRATLVSLVQDFVDRSLQVSLDAVGDAGIEVADVDEVILVGGQTRMPAIRDAITGAFGREPSRSVHPEEVVAMGAAVHAASIGSNAELPPAILIDVTPFDLGIDVAGNMFQAIIGRNSTIPTSDSRIFATAKSNQSTVKITVRQGSSRVANENEFLGEFAMSGLTPAPRMETKVEVTFQIDTNGMLRVSAMEPATGKQTEITVRNYAEVAKSKGAVSPNVQRAAGAEELPQSEDSQSAGGSRSANEVKGRPKKAKGKVVHEKRSGGLLSALFGRKKRAIIEPVVPKAEPDGGSIIDQVVAEREESQAVEAAPTAIEPTPIEPGPAPPTDDLGPSDLIHLPDLEPGAMQELETNMDEPIPIDLPPLDASTIDEAADDFPEPIAPMDTEESTDQAASLRVSPAPEPAPEGAPEPEAESEEAAELRQEQMREVLMERLSQPIAAAPEPEPEPEPVPPPVRKPARLKLTYKNPRAMVREYSENLTKGGCFIKTSKPLAVGRAVLIEVRVPEIAEDPISIPGEVTWSSRDLEDLGPDQKPGMGIEYHLEPNDIELIEARLKALA